MKPSEFARRRARLLKKMGRDSVAILPAAPQRPRNRDVDYPYRQDSDFLYLTGFPEPEAVAVLAPGREDGEYILFSRERDPAMETWNGRRAGQQGALDEYGADQAFPIGDLDKVLMEILEGCGRVYYTLGLNPEFDRRVIGWFNQLRGRARGGFRPPSEIVALEHLLHEMRLRKSRSELAVMRRAAEISAEAHKRAMRLCRPGMNEYELEAVFLGEFRRHGAEPSYPSIVGGGENACILHYTENNAELRDGDLVLIDAGAEVEGYAADITRTFPVNGRFSKEQRAIYDLVLKAQKAAIAKVRPGNHWDEPHRAAVRVLTRGLVELGLLKGSTARLIKDGAYKTYYMHRTGHWLGMDVHDVGDYKVGGQWRVFQPGMVLTVEPGLYIAPGTKGTRKRWWGIGVRIEDDVVVTRDGCRVLTEAVPKEAEEIEALMASRQ
jgi:Xaa-Pro aminopeptidase